MTSFPTRSSSVCSKPGLETCHAYFYLAAEQTGRKAFVMELDTLYADVIIDRWQRFTSKRAIHAETGAAFPKEPPAVPETMR
jgi:hypothetical protein